MSGTTVPPFDVLVVGGGPAGMSAALLLGRACRRVAVVDAGAPRNAAARAVHGYLGRDGVDPHAFRRDGREELARYGVDVFDDVVLRVEPIDDLAGTLVASGFRGFTRDGRVLVSRKLLFATGVQDELPDVPGLKECYGSTIHHCPYCDGWEHRGRRLLAFAHSSEAAVGLALSLKTWSESVTACTNGTRASDSERRRSEAAAIALVEKRVSRIMRDEDRLLGVEWEDGCVLEADAMFFNTSQRPSSELPRLLGCRVDEDGTIATHGKQRTHVPGVFLAGDADGDVQFVVAAAAEGARAAVAINRELQEEEQEARLRLL